MTRNTMRSIYHLKRRHYFHYPSIFVWAQHIAPKKCCPIKCWMVFQKWTLALMWKLRILKQPKQPKRNCWGIRKTKRFDFLLGVKIAANKHTFYWLFCLFFSQHRHILYQAIWLWISYSIIDVSILMKMRLKQNRNLSSAINVCISSEQLTLKTLKVNVADRDNKRRENGTVKVDKGMVWSVPPTTIIMTNSESNSVATESVLFHYWYHIACILYNYSMIFHNLIEKFNSSGHFVFTVECFAFHFDRK